MTPKAATGWLATILAMCAATVGVTATAAAQSKVRVGWCTSVISNGVAPFAIATKLGWYKELGLEVEIVNFPGSSDCVRNVATGEVLVAVPTVEPVAILSLTGVKTQVFYTAFRRNIFGIAVPEASPIKAYKDLKGAKIGVTSMASTGVVIARSVAASVGLDPDKDIRIVVSGQPAQTVVLLKRDEIQAASQWDTQYTLMGFAGVPMRMLSDPLIASFPANSLVALPATIMEKRDLLVKLARGYTMGAIYAVRNPKKATEIFLSVYPQNVPTGMPLDQAIERTTALLATVTDKWTLNDETKNWGESNIAIYQKYMDWLVEAKLLKQRVAADEIATNELIADINGDLNIKAVEDALAK
jgi:NitT/TauT family transport system substrate-binding protein